MSTDRLHETAEAQACSGIDANRNLSIRVAAPVLPETTGLSNAIPGIASRNRYRARPAIPKSRPDISFAGAGELFGRCRDTASADRVGAINAGTRGFSQFA